MATREAYRANYSNTNWVVPENIHTPHWGFFSSLTPHPPGFTIGQFQKISIPNHGRLPCFNPPLPSEIPESITPPMPSEFHNHEPPYPSDFPGFFWRYIFDLATFFIWTNEHEFMPPKGCDLAAPSDKLYSSATRKTYRLRVTRLCNPFFRSKFGYKKTPVTVIFLLFVFLCCFDVHKAK